MNWFDQIVGSGTGKSSKRLISIIAVLILIEITQVFLFSSGTFNTTQFIFLTGFWMFVAGFAQYLTVWNKNLKDKFIDNDNSINNTSNGAEYPDKQGDNAEHK